MLWRVFQLGCLVMLIALAVLLQFVPRGESMAYEGDSTSVAISREALWAQHSYFRSGRRPAAIRWRVPGIGFERVLSGMWTADGDPILAWTVEISVVWIAFFLSIPPAVWALRFRQAAMRWLAGDRPCPKCGYDLRATPDRCPECGTATDQNPQLPAQP